jgi:energy-coupling factor transport system ATP-binding protein
LTVAGISVGEKTDIWVLRRKAGMVFQNPDNQFVSSVVEDDVAFGLENYLVSRELIPELVSLSLSRVDMQGYEKKSPQMLSGGQKQRVAIAGVLALDPDILIFDEATAMLDPEGRKEVLGTPLYRSPMHFGATSIEVPMGLKLN